MGRNSHSRSQGVYVRWFKNPRNLTHHRVVSKSGKFFRFVVWDDVFYFPTVGFVFPQ